ncbi:hypothetical protein DBR11_01595 [Pedobacter sp. HMWF019]|uniref:AAA family ATPase n=1 Tax=Pedobacter sp. HMWF019 TaxID=2056856 RepID=UPI000D3BEB84|nr:AAA family ATPase [Pedobacter sp. HMWF019]PTT03688.1 hypothetical protein DBR11_01595 [Pedobacter sp. HMWF019]
MSFQAKSITKDHILEATSQIESNQISLHPGTGYEVFIEGRAYPPKEIIRYAHKLATGDDPGKIYGGKQVNQILRDLGFDVKRKIKFWKLGCNWESRNPSFFDIIQNQRIVITVDKFPFRINDIVLITEGFTVYALGKVISSLQPITELPQLQRSLEDHKVPFEDWLLYAEVEWYDLSDTQIFRYMLQQGIRQVHKQDVIDKVLDIWENRDTVLNRINFYVKEYLEKPEAHWQYPCFALIPKIWNDFGFQTCFELFLYTSTETREGFGEIKILQRDETTTKLSRHFTSLSPDFCSLGQTLSYYKTLRISFPSEFIDIGRALRDCVLIPGIREEFEQLPGFQRSLVRSSEALKTLYESNDLLQQGLINPDPQFNFTFEYMVSGAAMPHVIDFSFNCDNSLPNSFFCLIGKNGTGKTQILSQLAKKLSNNNEAGEFRSKRPLFTKIIAVSFSLFDKFEIPKTEDISYELISFKDNKGQLDEAHIANRLWRAYSHLLKSRTRKNIWLNCIQNSLDIDFMRMNLAQLETIVSQQDFEEKLNSGLSSGQRIIFHFITRLISVMEQNSIVIFDEPETHLHPNIAGKLISALRYVLRNFGSVCILATHSPVIVQEIPSRFIRILEREDNIPMIRQPLIECLGENLTNINNDIFRIDQENALYKITLHELANRFTMDQIDSIFNNQLSFNAKVYLQTIIRSDNGQL